MAAPPWAERRFRPSRLAPGAHLQTILPTALRWAPALAWDPVEVETEDGEVVLFDRLPGHDEAARRGQPWVVAVHGLEGSSESRYIRRLLAGAAARGWRGGAMNHRGCGGSVQRTGTTYNLRRTEDLAGALAWLEGELAAAGEAEADTPILVVGYSLGGSVTGNTLLRLAEEGTLPDRVAGAALVSTPLDARASAKPLSEGLGHRIYGARFLNGLKQKVRERPVPLPETADLEAADRAKRLPHFDDVVTAPLIGHEDAMAYYTAASVMPRLPEMPVPVVCLNAENDPIVPGAALPTHEDVGEAPVWLTRTKNGGHVGWDPRGERGWLETTILDMVAWMVDEPETARSVHAPPDGVAWRLD